MDKNTLLFLFVLALLSSQLWSMTWNIGLAAFYLIIIIMGLNYISPDASTFIKVNIIKLINLDFSVIMDIFVYISKFILSIFSYNGSAKTKQVKPTNLQETTLQNTKEPTLENTQETESPNTETQDIDLQDTILEKDNIEYRKLTV